MLDRIIGIVAKTFKMSPKSVTLESSSDTVETWDSLQHVHLVLALEEEFGIQFEVDEIVGMQSVRGVVAVVRQHLDEHPK